MILKGSQRAGANQLSAHLLNDRDNEHVRVHELRGFAADDLRGALSEAFAVSKGTRCKQFLFSLSLNPPKGASVSEKEFERAADEAEAALGLTGQPRAIVFHEKEGRRHAHVVWSRVDARTMTAINLPYFKRKLTALSRELFLQNEWSLPDGLRSDGGRNPLNFTLAEWQQAKRQGRDPREIKAVFREAYLQSDSLKAIGNALAERGYFLAGGNRGVVAVDTDGAIYSLSKWAGVQVREARAKLGEAENLPSVETVQAEVGRLMSAQMRGFIADLKVKQSRQKDALGTEVRAMRDAHDGERARLHKRQSERWAQETQERAERLHAGLRGLWDNFTGRARTIRALNEHEALEGLRRDRAQRDELIFAQLRERAPLQARLDTLRKRHVQDRRLLARQVVQHLRHRARPDIPPPDPRAPRRRGLSHER